MSFHLSLWTSLSSPFNHFGSSFLNSTQFKNKLNSPPLWIEKQAVANPWRAPALVWCIQRKDIPLFPIPYPTAWKGPVEVGKGTGNLAGQSWRIGWPSWGLFSNFLLIDDWLGEATVKFGSESKKYKSVYKEQEVLLLCSPPCHPSLKSHPKLLVSGPFQRYFMHMWPVCISVCMWVSPPPFLDQWWYIICISRLFYITLSNISCRFGDWSIFTHK